MINFRKLLMIVASMLLGGVCLWFAARNVDTGEVERIVRMSDWRWICAGILIFGTDLLMRSARWFAIVSHRRKGVSYASLTIGLFVGYAVNILLPARLGELFRADYTARLTNISRSSTLASIFLERVIDLFAVLLIFTGGLLWTGVDTPSIDKIIWTGFLILGFGILLICLALFRTTRLKELATETIAKVLPRSLGQRLLGIIGDFTGLLDIIRTRRMMHVVALSIPIWTLEALSVLSVCRGVGLILNSSTLMVLLGGASLSTLLPTGPGFVGTYQLGYLIVLRNFGVPDALSLVASSAVQIFVMGFYAVFGLFIWIVRPMPSSFLTSGQIKT